MKVRLAVSFAARARGLLLRRRSWLGESGVLLLAPCSAVHTFGMREAIDVAFVGHDGRVLGAEQLVGPMRSLRCRDSVAVLERFSPCDADAKDACDMQPWFEVGDEVGLRAEHLAGTLWEKAAAGRAGPLP